MKIYMRWMVRKILGVSLYEKIQFRRHTGYWGNFKSPSSFNEWLCARKIYRTLPESVLFQDKYLVRDFIKERIGERYLTKLYQSFTDENDLDYESLPKSFVVKGTNACGSDSLLIVHDKATISERRLRESCSAILSRHKNVLKRFWFYSNEWWYDEIPARIIIEEHLSPETGIVPVDYKFFVFSGRVEYVQVDFGRFVHHTRTLYDRAWSRQDFQLGYPLGPDIACPRMLPEMIEIAESLGAGVDFLRVDLYQIDDERIVFGELTVCPSLGHGKFDPPEWDKRLGKLWSNGLSSKE